MARHRLPTQLAKITGADKQHPARHAGRSNPTTQVLGAAPAHLSAAQRKAWATFADEMPWLGASDRALVEVASRLRVLITEPDAPMAGFAQLRMCLSSMGGTPADRSRVPPGDEPEDDADRFFQ